MDKVESSLESLVNISSKNGMTKVSEWGVRDFNNVETADRKLIVNNKLEFWVHDELLATCSDFFADLFGENSSLSALNVSDISFSNNTEFKKSEIIVPYVDLFFDILLWVYTKDHKKLRKAAKTFYSFLYLISLGIHLKMKAEFFEILLYNPIFEWKVELFNEAIWSKSIFTFPILETIVEQMKVNSYTKMIAILSWLKEIEPNTNTIIATDQVHQQILTSQDLFLVRNYIKRNNLMSGLKGKEIAFLLKMFPGLHSAFDTSLIVDEFIFSSGKRLLCQVCKKEFNSPFEVAENIDCKGEVYHPKNLVSFKNDKAVCPHEGCGKKFNRSEFSCCHKSGNTSGCTLGEGRHVIVFSE